jgi:glutathione S-transferase
MTAKRALDVTTSWAVSVARLGAGYVARRSARRRPEKLLELYEFEGCPFCRRVREYLSESDLEAMIYPCPKGGTRFRERVRALGGKAQFPFLVDPNTGHQLYESRDIIRYLATTYGDGRVPPSAGPLGIATSSLGSLVRGVTRGVRARSQRAPEQPLVLYSYEASPYCRIVRERLCELELPYHLVNVAKKSPHRRDFVARSGKMMVPYLVDPNTAVAMFESADIAAYLDRTYG